MRLSARPRDMATVSELINLVWYCLWFSDWSIGITVNLVIVKKNSPKNLSADCWSTVSWLSADCQLTVGCLSADRQPTGFALNSCKLPVGWQMIDCRPIVGNLHSVFSGVQLSLEAQRHLIGFSPSVVGCKTLRAIPQACQGTGKFWFQWDCVHTIKFNDRFWTCLERVTAVSDASDYSQKCWFLGANHKDCSLWELHQPD